MRVGGRYLGHHAPGEALPGALGPPTGDFILRQRGCEPRKLRSGGVVDSGALLPAHLKHRPRNRRGDLGQVVHSLGAYGQLALRRRCIDGKCKRRRALLGVVREQLRDGLCAGVGALARVEQDAELPRQRGLGEERMDPAILGLTRGVPTEAVRGGDRLFARTCAPGQVRQAAAEDEAEQLR